MGNNQTAFYYGLNYGDTNDSGYFDDELSQAVANLIGEDHYSNASSFLDAQYADDVKNTLVNDVNIDSNDNNSSAHVNGVTSLPNGNRKRMTKSKSIEIASATGSPSSQGLSGSYGLRHRRRVQSTISDIEEEQNDEDDVITRASESTENEFSDDHDDHESDVFAHECTCDKCNSLNSTLKNNHKQNFDVYSSSWSPSSDRSSVIYSRNTSLQEDTNNKNQRQGSRVQLSLDEKEAQQRLDNRRNSGFSSYGDNRLRSEQLKREQVDTGVDVSASGESSSSSHKASPVSRSRSLLSSLGSYSYSQGMNLVGRVKDFYYGMNPATLTGAIDVIVVQQEDGSFKCSPFHVRFGKLALIKTKDLIVDIQINGEPVDLCMKLGEAGEAYFVEESFQQKSSSSSQSSSCESLVGPTSSSSLTRINSSASNKMTMKSSATESTLAGKSSSTSSSTSTSTTVINQTSEAAAAASLLTRTKSDTSLKLSSSSSKLVVVDEKAAAVNVNQSSSLNCNQANSLKVNFFSDGEITPELTSPVVSRPPTPKSDTEVETKAKRDSIPVVQNDPSSQWSWSWGKLPERQDDLTPTAATTATVVSTVNELTVTNKNDKPTGIKNRESTSSSSGLLGSMFNLIGTSSNETKSPAININTNNSSNRSRNMDEVYLDDTEKLDSEIAALYLNPKTSIYKPTPQKLPQAHNTSSSTLGVSTSNLMNHPHHKDDDQESGNGISLPQSPRDLYSILGDIQISLCGLIPVNQYLSANSNMISTSQLVSTSSAPQPILTAAANANNTTITNTTTTTTTTSPNNNNQLSAWSSTSSLMKLSSSPNTDASLLMGLSTSPGQSQLMAGLPASPTQSSLFTSYTSTNTLSTLDNTSDNCLQINYEDLFQHYAVSFEKFLENIATITNDPNLVVKINNRYMNWASASPIILSALVYQKPLPTEITNMVLEANLPKVANAQNTAQVKQSTTGAKQPAPNQQQQQQQQQSYIRKINDKLFGSWSKKQQQQSQSGEQVPAGNTKAPAGESSKPGLLALESSSKLVTSSSDYGLMLDEEMLVMSSESTSQNQSSVFLDDTKATESSAFVVEPTQLDKNQGKTTRLSSDLIKKLNLNPGPNEIVYSVTTALQGTTRIESYIFLWNYDDKVIVSDIDGTITKSDVWGQIYNVIGRDWTQAGVADLYSAIEKNHYKLMYLSARAIGQSRITRDLLRNVNQGGLTLPKGPLLITPTSLFKAFQKEVIEKKPEEFKISCLKDIQSLFPSAHNPFYAGYGNKTSDVKAYKEVGVPQSRIFTINPQGELKHEVSRTFQSSYSKLCDFVDLIFPPLKPSAAIIKAEYDSFNFWRNTTSVSDECIMNEIDLEMKRSANAQTPKDSKENPKTKPTKVK